MTTDDAEKDPAAGEQDRCVAVIRQTLAVVDGSHALLLPVRDKEGDLTDFRIVAASDEARDLSGRRGDQLVGLCVRQDYPDSVRGEVWDTYVAVLSDGQPRTVGPFRYAGPAVAVPADLTIEVSVRRVGQGVIISWLHHHEEGSLSERIAQTERLGNLGWSEHDLVTGAITWSDQLYRIYGRDPAAGPPTAAESDAMTLPEDRPLRSWMAEQLSRGVAVDVAYRIRTADGVRHLRVVADTVQDAQGRPLRSYGIVQDITTRETSRSRIAEVEQRLQQQQQDLAAEHRLVAELQEIILPLPLVPIDLPGLRVAVRYLPAEQANRIGGDWYHAAPAYDGSVVLAVGDVAGHGIRAAATMAQLRHAFVTLTSMATSDPAELLRHLNRLLYVNGEPTTVASAVVARFDPETGTLRWSQAGHPAPLRTRGGVTTELRRPSGALLGAMPEPAFGTASVSLSAGDLLLFYTDGLIERRGRDIDEGLAPVKATLDKLSANASVHPLADLLAKLDRANPNDDTCVLGIRTVRAATVPAPAGAEPDTVGARQTQRLVA